MKNKFFFLSLVLIIPLCFFASACSSSSSNSNTSQRNTGTASSAPSTSSGSTSQASKTEKTFTLDELTKYNGQNGSPAYVAINGTVYDVTNARSWQNGKHKDGATAGKDLTDLLAKSPHGDKVLKDLPIVGKIKK